MSLIMFADGFLTEEDESFLYTLSKTQFKNTNDLEKLKFHPSERGLPLEHISDEAGNIIFTYLKTNQKMRVLNFFRDSLKKSEKAKLHDLAEQIIELTKIEYDNGFFVLPVPENFLVTKEGNVSFIYKALPSMPITNFGFNQIEKNLKRLILFLFTSGSYADLLNSKKIETKNIVLIDVAKAQTFDELYLAVSGNHLNIDDKSAEKSENKIQEQKIEHTDNNSEKEEQFKTPPPPIENIEQEMQKQKKIVPDNTSEKEEQIKTPPPPEKIEQKVQKQVKIESYNTSGKEEQFKTPPPPEEHYHVKKTKLKQSNKASKLQSRFNMTTIILSIVLLLSIIGNSMLIVEKVTYPSRIAVLKSDNKDLEDSFNKLKKEKKELDEDVSKYQTEEKNLKTENEELKTEIEENVKTIKTILEKNKELQESLKK